MKPPLGFLFSGIHSGIKAKDLDLGLISIEDLADCICFFTTNKVKSAPILLNLKNLKKNNSQLKAIIVNSGNANCFTGKEGLKDAQFINKKLSELLHIESKFILSASTGIIGRRLPLKKILNNLNRLVSQLKPEFRNFSEAILTTDTRKKVSFREVNIGKASLKILGIAKGSGMIYPTLKKATMLAFILTDANIKKVLLETASWRAVESSFNSISVDGCMSTNDSVFVVASGKASHIPILKKDKEFYKFSKALGEVMLELAKKIVRDAEGSTKFIEIEVKGAKTKEEAKKAGLGIADSNLFKASVYGEEPNWGRIVSSLGQAQIPIKENITISSTSLKAKNIKFKIDLKRGNYSWKVYTSDLTPDYIKINSNYS